MVQIIVQDTVCQVNLGALPDPVDMHSSVPFKLLICTAADNLS